MSLNNKNDSPQPDVIIIEKKVRTGGTQAFGSSVVDDFAEAMGPASSIVDAYYRWKATKAVEKRNRIVGTYSEYLDLLVNTTVGNHYSVGGKIDESNFFEFICRYCKAEIFTVKRNEMLQDTNPKVEELLANPPSLNMGHLGRINYCNKIIMTCLIDMVKFKFNEFKAKKEV